MKYKLLTRDERRQMLTKRLHTYEQRHFDAVLNHEVAVAAGNKQIEEEASLLRAELSASIKIVRRRLKKL